MFEYEPILKNMKVSNILENKYKEIKRLLTPGKEKQNHNLCLYTVQISLNDLKSLSFKHNLFI